MANKLQYDISLSIRCLNIRPKPSNLTSNCSNKQYAFLARWCRSPLGAQPHRGNQAAVSINNRDMNTQQLPTKQIDNSRKHGK